VDQRGCRQIAGPDGQRAGSDGGLGDAAKIVERGRQIEVTEPDQGCIDDAQTGRHRCTLAGVRPSQHPSRRIGQGGAELVEPVGRAVGAAIVDEDQLAARRELRNEIEQHLGVIGQPHRLIEHGHDQPQRERASAGHPSCSADTKPVKTPTVNRSACCKRGSSESPVWRYPSPRSRSRTARGSSRLAARLRRQDRDGQDRRATVIEPGAGTHRG